MTQQQENFVGIDVCKDSLDVAFSSENEVNQDGNHGKGITRLVAEQVRKKPSLIVVEATGGYEESVVSRLIQAGLPVVQAGVSKD